MISPPTNEPTKPRMTFEDNSLARLIHALAAEEAGNQTDYEPRHTSGDHITVSWSIDLGEKWVVPKHSTNPSWAAAHAIGGEFPSASLF
jgi:hypothetical protein